MVPVAIFDDPVDHTVYIPNGGEDDVSMLDSATCNATGTTPTGTVAGVCPQSEVFSALQVAPLNTETVLSLESAT